MDAIPNLVPAPVSPAPADHADVFPESRSYRRLVLVGAVVFGTIVAVLTVLHAVDWYAFRPQSTIADYFAALAGRDAAAAGRLLDTDADPDAPVRLDPAALRSGGYTPPTDVQVGEVRVRDGDATAAVTFALGGERHNLTLQLRRDERATAGLFYRWRIVDGGTYPLSVGAAGVNAVVIAGVIVPFGENSDAVTVAAYPGAYAVALPEQPLLTAPETTAYAGVRPSGSAGFVNLVPAVTEAARREIEQQVQAYLQDCASRAELRPDGCPPGSFGGFRFGEVRNVRWTITREPEIELRPLAGGPVGIQTSKPGEAEVTWQEVSSFDTYNMENTVAIDVSGTVVVFGGKVTVRFSN